MRLSFTLHNKTELVQDFEIKMIQDDDVHFAAAGNQMVCMDIALCFCTLSGVKILGSSCQNSRYFSSFLYKVAKV